MKTGWIIALAAICLLLAGCMNHEKTFTLKQVKDLFEQFETPLTEVKEWDAQNVFLMTLNGVAPKPFHTTDDRLISIYVYSSNEEVKKAEQGFRDKTATAGVEPHGIFHAANVLILCAYDVSLEDDPGLMVAKELHVLAKQ